MINEKLVFVAIIKKHPLTWNKVTECLSASSSWLPATNKMKQ